MSLRNTNTETSDDSYPAFPRNARVREQLEPWLESLEEWAARNKCAGAMFNLELARAPAFTDLTDAQQQQLAHLAHCCAFSVTIFSTFKAK